MPDGMIARAAEYIAGTIYPIGTAHFNYVLRFEMNHHRKYHATALLTVANGVVRTGIAAALAAASTLPGYESGNRGSRTVF